jgi:hypothetical protein
MLALARGHDIGRDADGFFARPRKSAVGPARLLRDIAAMARKAIAGKVDNEQWITAWVALPQAISRLWKPTRLRTEDGLILDRSTILSYQSPGFTTIVPKPEHALPFIVAETERRKTIEISKIRQRDEAKDFAAIAIRTAYQKLTGRNGGRTIRNGKRTGPLDILGHEIDQIFGTNLYPKIDGGRDR